MTLQIRSILFDLDNTLLGNDINSFVANYIPLLTRFLAPIIDTEIFIEAFGYSTQAMIDDVNPKTSNAEVFWTAFHEISGIEYDTISSAVDEFYLSEFRKLRSLTNPIPAAKKLLELCVDKGFQIAIATNPLFPLTAIKQRLEWANISTECFQYDLVTSYENMHAAKPSREYFREILSVLGAAPWESIMVGDEWLNDIAGASNSGLYTFWIDLNRAQPEPDLPGLIGRGSLESFLSLIENGDIQLISQAE